MSILRRVHSNNFTIVGNACLCDETLSAEALGVICYLIGRPHDWVVQPGQLATRFNCGRDRIQRIVRELIEQGYIIRAQRRANDTGAFLGMEYVVLDTKESELPKGLLAGEVPQPENTVTGEPENPQPGNPAPGNGALQKTDSTKTDSNKPRKARGARRQIAYSERFETRIWQPYPMKEGTSKANAFKKFEALAPEDQARVEATIPVYARMQERQKFSHHLEFYISRRIFDTIGLAAAGPAAQAAAPGLDRQTWENLSRIYENSNNWSREWGPEPGQPGCRMPDDLQKKFVNHGLTAH